MTDVRGKKGRNIEHLQQVRVVRAWESSATAGTYRYVSLVLTWEIKFHVNIESIFDDTVH